MRAGRIKKIIFILSCHCNILSAEDVNLKQRLFKTTGRIFLFCAVLNLLTLSVHGCKARDRENAVRDSIKIERAGHLIRIDRPKIYMENLEIFLKN